MATNVNLANRRRMAKLSQRDAAERCYVHYRTWQEYEAGRREPRLSVARRMAAVLGCTLEDLWPE